VRTGLSQYLYGHDATDFLMFFVSSNMSVFKESELEESGNADFNFKKRNSSLRLPDADFAYDDDNRFVVYKRWKNTIGHLCFGHRVTRLRNCARETNFILIPFMLVGWTIFMSMIFIKNLLVLQVLSSIWWLIVITFFYIQIRFCDLVYSQRILFTMLSFLHMYNDIVTTCCMWISFEGPLLPKTVFTFGFFIWSVYWVFFEAFFNPKYFQLICLMSSVLGYVMVSCIIYFDLGWWQTKEFDILNRNISTRSVILNAMFTKIILLTRPIWTFVRDGYNLSNTLQFPLEVKENAVQYKYMDWFETYLKEKVGASEDYEEKNEWFDS